MSKVTEPAGRRPRADTRVGARGPSRVILHAFLTVSGAIVIAALFTGAAIASPLATWTPSYSGSGNGPYADSEADPGNTGSGSLVYNTPVSTSLTTGTATFAFTGTATGAAPANDGYYGASQNDGGIVLMYTCSGVCTSGTHTLTFFWNLTYNWSITTKCPSGVTESAHETVSVISEVIDQAGYTVIGSQTNAVDNTVVLTCVPGLTVTSSSNPGAIPVVSTVTMSLSLGHSYNFTSFVHTDGYGRVCPTLSCTSASGSDFARINIDFASGRNGAVVGRVILV
jgi:hypothetical protein